MICRRLLVAKSLPDASVIDKLPYANYDCSYVRSKLCSFLHMAAGQMWIFGWNYVWNLAICCRFRMLYRGCASISPTLPDSILSNSNLPTVFTLNHYLSLFLHINCTLHCRAVTCLYFDTWLSRNWGCLFVRPMTFTFCMGFLILVIYSNQSSKMHHFCQ